MEENKSKGVRLVTVLFVITLIIIAIMGTYIYMDKRNNQEQEVVSTQQNIVTFESNNVNTAIVENSIENITNTNSMTTNSIANNVNDENVLSSVDAQKIIQKYIDITYLKSVDPLAFLKDLGLVNSSNSNDYQKAKLNGDMVYSDEYYKTNVKYENYLDKISDYMTKEHAEKIYKKDIVNVDGILYILAMGGSTGQDNIQDINLLSNTNDIYVYQVSIVSTPDDHVPTEQEKKPRTVKVTIKNVNDNYIVADYQE